MNDPNHDHNLDSTDLDSTKANSADEAKLSDASTTKPRQSSRTSDIYERFLNRVKHIENRGETEVSDADKTGLIKAKKQSSAFAVLRAKKRPPSDNDESSIREDDAGLNPDFDWNFDFEDDSDYHATDHNTEDERDKSADAAKTSASIDGYPLKSPDEIADVDSPYDSPDIDIQLADSTATFDDELPADSQHIQNVQTDETDAVTVEAKLNLVAEPVISAPSEQASSKKRLMIGGIIGIVLSVVIVLALQTTGILFKSGSATGNNVTSSDTKDTATNKNSDTALTDTKLPASEVSNAPAMIAEASTSTEANTDISTNLNNVSNDLNTDKVKTDENAVPMNEKQANKEQAPASQTKSAEQTANDEPTISYDDFAQEAKSTLYRDIDD